MYSGFMKFKSVLYLAYKIRLNSHSRSEGVSLLVFYPYNLNPLNWDLHLLNVVVSSQRNGDADQTILIPFRNADSRFQLNIPNVCVC